MIGITDRAFRGFNRRERVLANDNYAVAACSGAVFLAHGLKGLRPASYERWARAEFIGSLAYLVVLLSVLVLDHARYV